MAGKRQHFIPKFLQEGFIDSTRRGKKSTWVFRRDTQPFNTNIANVGVEGKFYTSDQDTTVDDAITKDENDFSVLLNEIRSESHSVLSDSNLPRLIAHLEIRTRNLRENLFQVSEFLVSQIVDFMSNEEMFTSWLKSTIYDRPSIIRESIEQHIKEHNFPEFFIEPLLMMATRAGPDLIDQNKPEYITQVSLFREIFHRDLRKLIKGSHIKALKKSIAPDAKIEWYEHLIYKVVSVSKNNSMILGDSTVIFHTESARIYKPFLEESDKLLAVYLPISSNQVLVGSKYPFSILPSDIQEAAARCSLEYFIADANTDRNRTLQTIVGSNAQLLSKEEMKSMIDTVFSEKESSVNVSVYPVFDCLAQIFTAPDNQNNDSIALILETVWGRQGFLLNKDMANDLLEVLTELTESLD